MNQAVLKLGGSVLRGAGDAAAIKDIIDSYEDPLVVVASALKGVTDALAAAADRDAGGPAPEALIAALRKRHLAFAEALDAPAAALAAAAARLDRIFRRLFALLARADPRDRPEILGTGERLSATCVALAFAALGRPVPIVEPRALGLLASEGPDGPSVDLDAAGPSIRAALESLPGSVVPGFYGVDAEGRPVLFGRGGSDYSAAIIAAALGARRCDLVKDVPGFLTADPLLVAGARPVFELSYEEAEALARGGARILHHRTVGPLRAAGIPLRIIGGTSSGGGTRIGPRPLSREGARAIALGAGPAGSARITVACCGWAAKSAALVIGALEASGVAARGFSMGQDGASFAVLVDGARGEEGLRIAHAALFEASARAYARPVPALRGPGLGGAHIAQKPGVA